MQETSSKTMLGHVDVPENVAAASKQLVVSLDHQKHVKSAIKTPDILNRESYVNLDLIPPNMTVVQQRSLSENSRDVSSKCVCRHDGWKIEFDGTSNGSGAKMNYGMFFSKFLDNFFTKVLLALNHLNFQSVVLDLMMTHCPQCVVITFGLPLVR